MNALETETEAFAQQFLDERRTGSENGLLDSLYATGIHLGVTAVISFL